MKVMSLPVILVLVMLVFIATLTEVIVAEVQMAQLRETGTSQMELELRVSQMRLLVIPLKTSSLEIGELGWCV
jgi:ABC-type maltose transport system permease subunit